MFYDLETLDESLFSLSTYLLGCINAACFAHTEKYEHISSVLVGLNCLSVFNGLAPGYISDCLNSPHAPTVLFLVTLTAPNSLTTPYDERAFSVAASKYGTKNKELFPVAKLLRVAQELIFSRRLIRIFQHISIVIVLIMKVF